MLIEERKGKKKGERGVTINIYEQEVKPSISKSITVHGYSVDEIFTKIKFFLKALEKDKKVIILVRSDEYG